MNERERRAYLRSQERCAECGGRDAYTINGRYRCAECNTKHNERQKRDRERRTQEQRKRELARKAAFVRKRIEAGLCKRCGKKVDRDGVFCSRCCVRVNAWHREYYRAHHEGPMKGDDGFCYICLKPAMQGRKVCEIHYEKLKAAAEKARRQNKNHPWRALDREDVYRRMYKMGGVPG